MSGAVFGERGWQLMYVALHVEHPHNGRRRHIWKGRRKRASTTPKRAVVAPMPNAKARVTTTLSVGVRRIARSACWRS